MSYQRERDQFLVQFALKVDSPAIQQGPGGVELARKLLRSATTLHRLAEAQCNGDWPFDNGQRETVPCSRCEAGTAPAALRMVKIRYDLAGQSGQPHAMPAELTCPDCRMQDQVRKALHGSGWLPFFQGDPRGCVLWLHPDDGQAGERYTGNHPLAIAVPGRY